MRSRMTTFAVLLRLMLALPGFAHQAVGQEEGKPLLPPNFSATGDLVLVGYSIAPATALPFSAAIEAETDGLLRKQRASHHRHGLLVFAGTADLEDSPKSLFDIPKGYHIPEARRQQWHSYGDCPVP
jgi:hypothetical protein